MKAKIYILKNSYELAKCYLGFINYESKTWKECFDEAATYFYLNFQGCENLKIKRTIHNCNQQFRKYELFIKDKQQEKNATSHHLFLITHMQMMQSKILENLDGISVQKVHEYTHKTFIPHVSGYFLDRNRSEDDNIICLHTVHNDIISISKKDVLKFYGMREL